MTLLETLALLTLLATVSFGIFDRVEDLQNKMTALSVQT